MMWLLGAALSFVLDLLLGDPGEVAPSRGGHGQSHFPPGKDPAGGLSQNAEGENGRRALSWRCSCRWGRWR